MNKNLHQLVISLLNLSGSAVNERYRINASQTLHTVEHGEKS